LNREGAKVAKNTFGSPVLKKETKGLNREGAKTAKNTLGFPVLKKAHKFLTSSRPLRLRGK